MEQGKLLVIVEDARVLRLICHVAESLQMSCLGISRTDDIGKTYQQFRPDIILMDPELLESEEETVLHNLADQRANAAIILTNSTSDQTTQMKDLGNTLSLNMAGVLPAVFDADTLKQEFTSILKRIENRLDLDTDEASSRNVTKNINGWM
jgi:DNA-binding response OmpR family regulator